MQMNLKVFARVNVNGDRESIAFDLPTELRTVIAQTVKWLIDLPIESRDFSSLTIEVNKREILQQTDELAGIDLSMVQRVGDDDLYDESSGVTWGELRALQADVDWQNIAMLSGESRRDLTRDQIDGIIHNATTKWHGTKFWKLIGDKVK